MDGFQPLIASRGPDVEAGWYDKGPAPGENGPAVIIVYAHLSGQHHG